MLSAACGSTSSSTTTSPSPVRCAVAATANPSTFPASGGTGSLVVSAARECSWSAASQAAWIALAAPTEGQGDGRVTYTVAANGAASARRGTLVLGSVSAEVTQQAAPCRFELDRRSFELGAGEVTGDVNVQALAGCSWTARSSVPGIAIVEGAQGSGPGRVRFRVSAHTATTARSGSLEIAGNRVDVRQGGGAPPAPRCAYAIDPVSADAGPESTEGRLSVATLAVCAWTASSDQPWLAIVAGSSGSGPGEVRYRAGFNDGASVRTGRIAVSGAIFTLRQAPCSYELDPASGSFGAAGGRGEFDVRTEAPCAWTARAAASWIEITSRPEDTGNGRVTYEVAPNIGGARTGSITIAGRAFTVTQDAATSIFGVVSGVEGLCPTKRFIVRNQRVRTTLSTDYEGGRCRDVKDGVSLRVKGIVGSDGVMTASEVDF